MVHRIALVGRGVAVGLAICAGALTGATSRPADEPAQQQQPPPVFEGGATLVYVDVYPRVDGRVLEGLQKGDFQVFEDGRPQNVETFEFIRFDGNPLDSDRRDPNTAADSERQAADPRNRVFVIYLDLFHTTRNGSRDARQPLLDFLHRTIGPNDLFGVMTPDTSVAGLTFGRRTETIDAELARNYGAWGLADEMRPIFPRTAGEQRITSCAELLSAGNPSQVESAVTRFREDLFYASLEGLVVRLRDLRDERKSVLLLTEGWVPRGPSSALFEGAGSGTRGSPIGIPGSGVGTRPQSLPPIGVGRDGRLGIGDPRSLVSDRSWCEGQLSRLGQIDFTRRFRDLLAAAREANVTFLPISLGGLQVGVTGGVETLRTLAENTDGWAAVNTNDVGASLRQITERLAAYYLLGYYSTNPTFDGRFRRIEVKVTQPRVSVAARLGYLARRPIARRATIVEPSGAASTPDPVSAALARLGRLSSRQALFSSAVVHSDRVEVVVEIASREVGLPQWVKGAAVAVTVTDAAGVSARADGRIAAGERGVVVRVPIEGTPSPPLRIRVRATGDQTPTEDDAELAGAAGVLLGAPVLSRAAASPRAALHPAAELLFRRAERLHVEWPLLNTPDERSARLLSRSGQILGPIPTIADRVLADGRPVVALDLGLAGLAENDYLIEVTARRGSDVDRSLVAFRLVR
jgi:VWFA-related protein